MKIATIMSESGLDARGHRGKSLQHILDTLPRDDLFQASLEELRTISFGVLALEQRHKLKLFCRRETFGRYYSCLVYLPRDQYNERARRAIENVLLDGPQRQRRRERDRDLGVGACAARGHGADVGRRAARSPTSPRSSASSRTRCELGKTALREALLAELPEERALDLLHRYAEQFSAAYQDECERRARRARRAAARAARRDGRAISRSRSRAAARRPSACGSRRSSGGEPIPLYVALPILENLGLRVSRASASIRCAATASRSGSRTSSSRRPARRPLDPDALGARFKECFAAVLRGDAENDGFNSFVVSAGFDWREATLLRAFCKYVLQTRIGYSQAYMQAVLARYPALLPRADRQVRGVVRRRPTGRGARERARGERRRAQARARSRAEPRRRPDPAHLRRRRRRAAAHELLPARRGRRSRSRTSPSSSIRTRCPIFRSRGRSSRSSSTRSASRPCTCARRRSRAAASAGPIGARTSAPRCSA